jgi:hypothetical protein
MRQRKRSEESTRKRKKAAFTFHQLIGRPYTGPKSSRQEAEKFAYDSNQSFRIL